MEIIKEALDNEHVITFDVNNPQRSFAGYTVYRLVLIVCNDNGEVLKEEFLSWKRFNEFKKLHKDLKVSFPLTFHESFPEFAKKKIFGRFDESVIEERRQLSIKLLTLVCSNTEMLTHQSFTVFVEQGRTNKPNGIEIENLDENYEFIPQASNTNAVQQISIEEVDTETFINNDRIEEPDGEEQPSSHGDDDDVFLSLQTNNDTEDTNQSFFREARSICGEDLEGLASEAAEEFPFVSPRESSFTVEEVGDGGVVDEFSKLLEEENIPTRCESSFANNVINQIVDSNANAISLDIDHANEIRLDIDHKYTVDDKMSKIIEQTIEEDDYIFQASVAMSNATDQEAIGNSEAAFDLYKFGIGVLLRGVQTDDNKDRRDAVRRKTAQYLLKAESLYNGQLIPSCVDRIILGENKWRFKLSDVKVFGVVDKVMLVQKLYTDDVFIMKVLHKQGGEYKPSKLTKKKAKPPRNLYNCYSMSRLYNCVETTTGVYLLLEYITGGRLWDYLKLPLFDSYLRRNHALSNESCHSWNSKERSSSRADTSRVDTLLATENSIISAPTTPDNKNMNSVPSLAKTSLLEEAYFCKWAAQIAYGLMELHSKGIICRDLNPRNILIDARGNIKLTYFSNIEGIDYSLDQDAIEMLYTSPEADGVFEPTEAADWWSFGALLFELLMGEPLFASHPGGISKRSVITLPRRVSNEACSLLAGLLKYNPRERLGSGPNGNEEIKSHPFFNPINWKKIKSF